MKVAINVSVKYSAGAYTATLGRCRASLTASALVAVERVVGRYLEDSSLRVTRDPVCIDGPDGKARELWQFVVEQAAE